MKSKIIILLFFIVLFPFLDVFADEKIEYKKMDLNYEESKRIILNPERGLYRTSYTNCSREKCSDARVPARQELVLVILLRLIIKKKTLILQIL